MQQPPSQPPFDEPYGEPTQPVSQPPIYGEPTQPINQPISPYEPTQPIGQPPYQPEQPSAQPGPQPPERGPVQPPPPQGQSAPQAPGMPAAQPSQQPMQSVSPGRATWVTLSRLRGHPLIDIAEGKTIGSVHDVLLDENRRAIQAFSTKGSLFHKAVFVPARSATIGADAVTFQPGALAGQDTSWLENLPKASDLIGMRVLSNTGQLMGTVEDLRIDPESAALIALELAPVQTGIAHRLGDGRRLLVANNIISFGPDTIIAKEGSSVE